MMRVGLGADPSGGTLTRSLTALDLHCPACKWGAALLRGSAVRTGWNWPRRSCPCVFTPAGARALREPGTQVVHRGREGRILDYP